MGNDMTQMLKVVFVGEPKCGKTSIISAFTRGSPIVNQKPTLFENYLKEIEVEGIKYKLHICDTTGLSDFHRLKKMSFLNTDVFVVCVDYGQRTSMQKTIKWIDDVKKAGAPLVLCMTKSDEEKRYTREDVQTYANDHGFQSVVEVSVNDRKSIKRLFQEAVQASQEEVAQDGYRYCWIPCGYRK